MVIPTTGSVPRSIAGCPSRRGTDAAFLNEHPTTHYRDLVCRHGYSTKIKRKSSCLLLYQPALTLLFGRAAPSCRHPVRARVWAPVGIRVFPNANTGVDGEPSRTKTVEGGVQSSPTIGLRKRCARSGCPSLPGLVSRAEAAGFEAILAGHEPRGMPLALGYRSVLVTRIPGHDVLPVFLFHMPATPPDDHRQFFLIIERRGDVRPHHRVAMLEPEVSCCRRHPLIHKAATALRAHSFPL